jgi:hypothetical protein
MENRYLRVTVLPERGGAIFELLWKPTDVDLLWRWERGLRPTNYVPSVDLGEGNYQDHFFGGWDVLFPTVDRFQPVTPLPMGYHGEVAVLPWQWRTIADEPDEVAAELRVRCVRAPFEIVRVLRLRPAPELVIETTIVNTSEAEVHYAIGEHIAVSAEPFLPGRLRARGGTVTTPGGPHDARARLAPAQTSAWPWATHADGTSVDVSALDVNMLGTSDVMGVVDLHEPKIAFEPAGGRSPRFSISWDSALMPSLLLWFGLGGDTEPPWFGSTSLIAVEPMSLLPWEGANRLPTIGPSERLRGRTVVRVEGDG